MTDRGYPHGLGRILAPDDRDRLFPMSAVLQEPDRPRTRRFWYANSIWLDQGETPQCVEYAWHHWASDGPVTQARGQLWNPGLVYNQAQQEDGFPMPHDGTSVRAGAQVLQRMGYIGAYHWAFDLETVLLALITTGPVVMGTLWYSSMFSPVYDGTVFINAGAAVVGGHAWLLDGVNLDTEEVRAKNSWGRSWGDRGFFRMSFGTLERLIREDGEACLATEVKLPHLP